MAIIPADPRSSRKRHDRSVTPEVAGSSPVAPVFESDRGRVAVALNGFHPRVRRLQANHVEDLLRAMEPTNRV